MVSHGKSFEGEAAPEQMARLSPDPWGRGGKTLAQGMTFLIHGDQREHLEL